MDPLLGRFARIALAALLVAGYLAFAFPAIANLDIDGSVLFGAVGVVGVVALALTLVRPTRPDR